MGFGRPPFRDFEKYPKIVVGFEEDDFQLILKQFNSNAVTYETSPGIYSIKVISEFVYTMGDHEETLRIYYDDITMKTRFILKQFGGNFKTLGFIENPFFNNLINFTLYGDFKPTNANHADSSGVNTSNKIIN